MEELVSNRDFAYVFLGEVGLNNAEVISVEHSKIDAEYGESDITVIVSKDGRKYGVIIEDKVDALAMKEQCQRYKMRGKKGIQKMTMKNFLYLSQLQKGIWKKIRKQESTRIQ